MTHVLDDPDYWPEQYNAMKRDRDLFRDTLRDIRDRVDAFTSELVRNIPEHYDSDNAPTDIAIAYVRHLEEVAAAATALVDVTRVDVYRESLGNATEWRRMQEALWTVNGTWPE